MTHSITIRRIYNGSSSGYQTHHEINTPRGLSRVLPRDVGEGWGCEVIVREPSLTRLGGYRTEADQGVIPTPGGWVAVTVRE